MFAGVDPKPSDVDGLPYSTLLYGNGPGHSPEHRLVPMLNATDAETHNRLHGAAVPRQWATHGGEDVPVYAIGPAGITQALFSGTFDQSYVPHAIAYVACLAEHAKRCQQEDAAGASNRSGAAAGKAPNLGAGPSSQVRPIGNFFICSRPFFHRRGGWRGGGGGARADGPRIAVVGKSDKNGHRPPHPRVRPTPDPTRTPFTSCTRRVRSFFPYARAIRFF